MDLEGRLRCVTLQNTRNSLRVQRRFTGKVISHWRDGFLEEEEVNVRIPIRQQATCPNTDDTANNRNAGESTLQPSGRGGSANGQ